MGAPHDPRRNAAAETPASPSVGALAERPSSDHAPALGERSLSTIGQIALRYARRGYPVVPCCPAKKRPLIKGGLYNASSWDHAVIAMWSQHPTAMIGLPMGRRSGLMAIDLDIGDGKNGYNDWAAICKIAGDEPYTRYQDTPSGGRHYLLRWPEGVGNATRGLRNLLARAEPKRDLDRHPLGVDVRGEGGYIIVAPSQNSHGGRYVWGPQREIAAAPSWLIAALSPDLERADQSVSLSERARARPPRVETGEDRYAAAAFGRELSDLRRTARGGRNNRLNVAAYNLGQLVGAGRLNRGDVEAGLLDACAFLGLLREDGLKQCQDTIASGVNAGAANPRRANPRRAMAGARSGGGHA